MKAFQVDENLKDKKLIRSCNRSGECQLRSYPTSLSGLKDHKVVPVLLATDAPLVTSDFTLVEENARHVPKINTGVIVPRTGVPGKRYTTRVAAEILTAFKARFPDWSSVDWSNLHVEIYEDVVCVDALPARADFRRQTFRLDETFDPAVFTAAMRDAGRVQARPRCQ